MIHQLAADRVGIAAMLCLAVATLSCAKPSGSSKANGTATTAGHPAPVLISTSLPSASVAATTLPPEVYATATAGVDSKELAALLASHWDARMRRDPVWATMVGDHRFDAMLPVRSEAALAAHDATDREALAAAQRIGVEALTARDKITHKLFVGDLESARDVRVCRLEEWVLSPRDNELVTWSYLPEIHEFDTLADATHFTRRLEQMPSAIAEAKAALLRGKARGLAASKATMMLTLTQLDTEIANGWAKSPFAAATTKLRAYADLPQNATDRTKWLALADAVDIKLGPAIWQAYKDYRDMIRTELLPIARGEQEGLASLPGGEACYRALIRHSLGIDKTPQALHELGLAEIAQTDATITSLAKKLRIGPTKKSKASVASIAAALRKNPANYLTSAAELLAAGQTLLDRANAKTPAFFGRLPKTPCIVREIPAAEAPYQTIAYYREARVDGSKPGEYFINVYEPTTRPKFEFAALTFHESVPGHHLQIAIAQELGDMPAFRRHMGSTAFIEGWALYAERLAQDMELYDSDLQRLGAASFESWRAARLVVDTGIHAMGWTRAKAVAFMKAHTLLADNNIENEVDRYIGWPGQALAYKIGQLEILALRAYAQEKLGSKFSLPAFHDQVLLQGAVTLPVLREQIERWVALSR